VEEGTVVHQTFFLTTFANLKSPLIVLSTCSDGSQVRTFSSNVISLKVHCSTTPCNFKVSNSVGTCRQTTYIRFQLEEDFQEHWCGREVDEEQVEEGSLQVADKEEPGDINSTASSTSSVSDFNVSHEGFRPPSIGFFNFIFPTSAQIIYKSTKDVW
jgi:hypothetical protein